MLSNLYGTTIEQYLNLQDYYPVTSDEFIKEFDADVSVTNPEVGKMIALKTFVDRVVNAVKEMKNNPEQFQSKSGKWLKPVDDLVDSYWVLQTLKQMFPEKLKSMSGRSRITLGEPTKEWLEEKNYASTK